MTRLVPMHPEEVTGDPRSLAWVMDPASVPVQGVVASVPGRLGDLVSAGIVCRVAALPGSVVVTLGDRATWARDGAVVRTALHEALGEPEGWRVAESDDAAIAAAVTEFLEGPAADVVRRHGGSVRVVGVVDGTVTLEVGGACAGCPAAGLTIGTTLHHGIREEVAGVREVVVTEVASPRFVSLASLLRTRSPAG
ncbi:MAG: NifU family protein [Tetrasphaera sp.]|nr:NifU family protein [Tetrasphaera sp.]